MLYQDIRAALELALYNVDTSFPTAWENSEFVPADDVPYQRCQLVLYKPTNPTTDRDYRRENGEFQIFLSYPKKAGANPAYAKASVVASAFKRGTTLQKNTTKVEIMESPHVGTAMQFADRYVVPISTRFYVEVFE